MFATTKQVRSIVRSLQVVEKYNTYTWTDKCKDANKRLVAFRISEFNTAETVRKVNEALFLAGYTNTAKATHSAGSAFVTYSTGGAYLRIKAAYAG